MQAICHQCDVLVHEATNENAHQEKCIANGHSTPAMTAQFATAVEARMLIITHCSQRSVMTITTNFLELVLDYHVLQVQGQQTT